MDEKAGLGGAFSDIIIASPNEVCTEVFKNKERIVHLKKHHIMLNI